MRGRTRKLAYENIPDLCAAGRELSFESHRFQESLTSIVQSACGIEEEKGLLELRTAEYLSVSPIEWAKEMDELNSLLGPKSFLMGKVADCANSQMPIDAGSLPKCVLDEFPKSGSYESRLVAGLRREATGSFSVRTWEWVWIAVIRSFMGLHLEEKRTLQEQTAEDEFFFNLTRNFYLGLFHKSLVSLGRELKARLVNLIHIYLIEELLFKFRKREAKSQEVKYRLKSHYFYLLYLLILTNQELQEETVKVYYQFLEKIAENYSSTTVLTHNQNIRNMIRVWITLATRSVTVQSVLVDKLALANDSQGWFRLGRCPINKFEESLEKLVIGSRELGRANAAKEGIIRLLDKFNEWLPSYSMLATIQQLLVFQEKRFHIDYRKDQEEEGSILVRALERTFLALLQESRKETVTPHYQRIDRRIEQLYQRGLAVNLNIQPMDKNSAQPVSRSERGRLIGHASRNMNVWEYPLQHNEFALLFQFSHWLAAQLDRLLPGKPAAQPRINMRILANPLIFFSLLILLSLLLRLA